MNDSHQTQGPRRAAMAATPADGTQGIQVTFETPARGARRARPRLARGAVAGAVASVLLAGSFLGLTLANGNAAQDLGSDRLSDSAAIPAAAASAAAKGFADRSETVSRNVVRSNLADAVAAENAKDREAAMEESVHDAHETMTAEQAAERDRLMDEDMKLVAKQADKLKKEAEAAAKRLAEARKAAAAMGLSASDFSAEELEALTTAGGSMPMKSNFRIGASFGQRGVWSRWHTGQDFPAPVGTPVYAVASGIVLSPTSGGWAGTNVVIQHANGGATLYAHLSKRLVSVGDAVKAGQLIGYSGQTGRAFGPHLHFEYYKPGVTPGDVYNASNPMTFLKSLGVR